MKKILLFDFDGVIVNSFHACLETNTEIGTPITPDDYRKLFEGNIYENREEKPEAKDLELNTKDQKFFEIYNNKLIKLDPVEGMVEVVESLKDEYTLIIVSSSIDTSINEYLRKHSLIGYFGKVFDVNVHKSKIAKINMVFEEYDVAASDCLFITDTLGDLREASKVGVDGIGVTWGWHPEETLEKGSPVSIVDQPVELKSAIDEYFS